MEIADIVDLETVRACARLFTDVNNAPPWNDGWTEDRSVRRLTDIFSSPGSWGIAASSAQRLVAFLIGNIEAFYDGDHFCLREMVVATEAQRRGLGSRLLAEAERRLRAQGVSEVYLLTSRGNGTAEFYEKNGYAGWTTMTMMGKAIRADRGG